MLYIGWPTEWWVNPPVCWGCPPFRPTGSTRHLVDDPGVPSATTVRGLRTARRRGPRGAGRSPVGDPTARDPPARARPGRDPDPADQVGESVDAAQRRRAPTSGCAGGCWSASYTTGPRLRISALALRLGLLRPPVPGKDEDWQDRIVELQDELHAVLQELRDVLGRSTHRCSTRRGWPPRCASWLTRSASSWTSRSASPRKNNDSVRWPRARHTLR